MTSQVIKMRTTVHLFLMLCIFAGYDYPAFFQLVM